MQKYANISKYAKKIYENILILYTFLVILDHKHCFKPNLYFYVIYANMQYSGL